MAKQKRLTIIVSAFFSVKYFLKRGEVAKDRSFFIECKYNHPYYQKNCFQNFNIHFVDQVVFESPLLTSSSMAGFFYTLSLRNIIKNIFYVNNHCFPEKAGEGS